MTEESTTRDLVELVRTTRDVVNRRDLDALMRFYAPDAVFDTTRTVGVMCEGREAIRSLLQDWFGAYDELEVELEEALDLGNGVVFAVVRQHGRPTGSIGHVQQREGFV